MKAMIDRYDYILARIDPKDRVLHVGCCGNDWEFDARWAGKTLHRVLEEQASEVYGIDILASRIAQMVKAGHNALVADAEQLMAHLSPELRFDVVVAGELIEHLTRPGDFLDQLVPFMAKDGKLILTTPNMTGFWSFVTYGLRNRRETHGEHVTGFKAEFLETMLVRHGWRCVDVSHVQAEGYVTAGRRFRWLKEIPERLSPRLRPIVVATATPAEV